MWVGPLTIYMPLLHKHRNITTGVLRRQPNGAFVQILSNSAALCKKARARKEETRGEISRVIGGKGRMESEFAGVVLTVTSSSTDSDTSALIF